MYCNTARKKHATVTGYKDKNIVKFRDVWFLRYVREQTDQQTDGHTHSVYLRSGGGGKMVRLQGLPISRRQGRRSHRIIGGT